MLQKILLITFSILLSSCSGMPKKPIVDIGIIDYPANEVIVNTTLDKIVVVDDLLYKNLVEKITKDNFRVPLSSYDKAVSFLPIEWEKVQNYIHLLEEYGQRHCQQ